MLFRRLTVLFAGLGLAASLALAAPAPAEASTKITVTATGRIVEGADTSGTFGGSPGDEFDLADLPATLVQVFTLTPGASIDDTTADDTTADDTTAGSIFAFFEQVTTTVTVNGNPVTFTSAIGSGFYNLLANTGLDASTSIFDGTTEFFAGLIVFDGTFTFDSLFDEFTFTDDPGEWSFGAALFDESLTGEIWSFFATPTSVTVAVEHVAVPVPAAIGIFLVGLAGLAAARRRG